MKKSFAISVLLMGTAPIAFAQDSTWGELSYGGRAQMVNIQGMKELNKDHVEQQMLETLMKLLQDLGTDLDNVDAVLAAVEDVKDYSLEEKDYAGDQKKHKGIIGKRKGHLKDLWDRSEAAGFNVQQVVRKWLVALVTDPGSKKVWDPKRIHFLQTWAHALAERAEAIAWDRSKPNLQFLAKKLEASLQALGKTLGQWTNKESVQWRRKQGIDEESTTLETRVQWGSAFTATPEEFSGVAWAHKQGYTGEGARIAVLGILGEDSLSAFPPERVSVSPVDIMEIWRKTVEKNLDGVKQLLTKENIKKYINKENFILVLSSLDEKMTKKKINQDFEDLFKFFEDNGDFILDRFIKILKDFPTDNRTEVRSADLEAV